MTKLINTKGGWATIKCPPNTLGYEHNGKAVRCLDWFMLSERSGPVPAWRYEPAMPGLNGVPYSCILDQSLVPFPPETDEDREFIEQLKQDEKVGALQHVFKVPEFKKLSYTPVKNLTKRNLT